VGAQKQVPNEAQAIQLAGAAFVIPGGELTFAAQDERQLFCEHSIVGHSQLEH
jgi:hypothetical protein